MDFNQLSVGEWILWWLIIAKPIMLNSLVKACSEEDNDNANDDHENLLFPGLSDSYVRWSKQNHNDANADNASPRMLLYQEVVHSNYKTENNSHTWHNPYVHSYTRQEAILLRRYLCFALFGSQ